MTEGEHHRDLVHEFPELKHRVHELKLASGKFRRLYTEYQSVDDEVHRIEQAIETPSDAEMDEVHALDIQSAADGKRYEDNTWARSGK